MPGNGNSASGGQSGATGDGHFGMGGGTSGPPGGEVGDGGRTPSCEETCSHNVGCPNDEAGQAGCLTICEGYRALCPVEAVLTDRCFLELDDAHLGCNDSGLTAIADESCSEESAALIACVMNVN